jgi:hypothetical protein
LWQRRSAQLHHIEVLDSGRHSPTKETVRFEVRKVIAVQGRNPLLLSASTARAWRHTRARVDRVAAPTYPDPATKAWLLASIASWRRQRSLQLRRRWHRSPATAHRTSAKPQTRPGSGSRLTSSRNSPTSQNVPPGHPSFRRQRASRACESKSPHICAGFVREKAGRESCGPIV